LKYDIVVRYWLVTKLMPMWNLRFTEYAVWTEVLCESRLALADSTECLKTNVNWQYDPQSETKVAD
jgi:hypothetical protein